MTCKTCFYFLQDFLLVDISKDLSLAKYIRIKKLRNVLPEYADWMFRLYSRLHANEFEKAYSNACQISRRGRKQIEYECILFTATSNFLSFNHPWFSKELDYMKVLLVEAGLVKSKYQTLYLTTAREYLTYMIPRCIIMLRHIHEDHLKPKGLMTDLSTTIGIPQEKDSSKETLCDQDDDYQKEILEEVELEDDLYT